MALMLCNYGLVLSLLIFSHKQSASRFKHLQQFQQRKQGYCSTEISKIAVIFSWIVIHRTSGNVGVALRELYWA